MTHSGDTHGQYIKEWDVAYAGSTRRHKNRWPSELVVSFALRTYRDALERGEQVRCLDLGCGWGNNLRFFLEEGFDALGVDYAPAAVEALQPEFGDRVRLADAQHLPFESGSFDLVIDRSSIQHNPLDALPGIYAEVYRVLRQPGQFFSIMVKDGSNDFRLTRLTEPQLRQHLAHFASLELNWQTTTRDHASREHSTWIIHAKKA